MWLWVRKHCAIPVSGGYNTAVGTAALKQCWGGDNTVVGAYGMSKGNSTGSENTGIGSSVLLHCTGSRNTASGHRALSSTTTGNHNVADGYLALSRNVDGSKNTLVGASAGLGIIHGEGNVGMGFQAGPSNDINDSICIGAGAKAFQNGDLALGSMQHPLSVSKFVGEAGDAASTPSAPAIYLSTVINGEKWYIALYKPPVEIS